MFVLSVNNKTIDSIVLFLLLLSIMAYFLLEKRIIIRRGQSYVKFVNEFLMVNAFVLVLRGIPLILMVLLYKKIARMLYYGSLGRFVFVL